MQSNASERFFWPNFNAAIRQTCSQCHQCNRNAPSQSSEPIISTLPSEYPFQQAVTDFADIQGHDFIVYEDQYSGWLKETKLSSKTWREVPQMFLQLFGYFGVSEEILSDWGDTLQHSCL